MHTENSAARELSRLGSQKELANLYPKSQIYT